MQRIVFLSEGRINIIDGAAEPRVLPCSVAEKYRERTRELRRKNEWKHVGTGAKFMNALMPDDAAEDLRLPLSGVARASDEKIAYSLNFETGGGVYFTCTDEPDTHVYVNTKSRFYELDVSPSGIIAVSCAEGYTERHICLIDHAKNDFFTITDGDCSDCNPRWSRKNEHILYYDSAGIGFTRTGHVGGYGPRGIFRLNTKTSELDEILSDNNFDCLCPLEDKDGNLFYIRRPYKLPRHGMSLKDILLAPFRVLRAIGGWLNFFSLRYTGEPINTSGANPAKAAQKSPQEIFIDGNLIEAEKNMKKNAAAGEKNPGYAPNDWQLIKRSPSGEETVLHKSVMSYCITEAGIVYSNGKYVISGDTAVKTHLAEKLA